MPKATTTQTKRAARSRGKTAQVQTADVPVGSAIGVGTVPQQWRESILGKNRKIHKTRAKGEYKLRDEDLASLASTKQKHIARGHTVDMILYKERDVERKAWERHGGPEGFDAYLAKLRGQHTRTRTTAFTQPSTYSSNGVYLSQARTRLSTFDMRTGTPQVLHRTQMEMPNWLWNVCNKILDWYDAIYADPYEGLASLYATTRSREAPMEAAARVARSYPPRPVATLPPSPTVDAVRAILAEAPRLPHGEPHEAWSEEALFARGITATHHSWPEDEYTYEWSSEYLDRLFSALCEVIIALGTGDAGWRAIRWEVHDKYLDCFKGMSYDRKERRWTDEAAQWLDGSYPTTGRDISFAVSSRSKSSEGERYNAALPYRTPQDVRRVGY